MKEKVAGSAEASSGRRRVLMLVSDMRTGGAERVAASLVKGWISRGLDVHLLATYSERVASEIEVPDTAHFTRLADWPGCRGGGVRTYIRRLRRLRAIVREKNPHVVVSFLTNVNVFALIALACVRIPIVVCERVDSASENETGLLLRWLRWVTYPLADVIAVQTARSAKSLSARVLRLQRIAVIPNPVPSELKSVVPVDRDTAGGRRVIALGRLSSQKRFDVLISAFATLAERHAEWDLWIWGEGPMRQLLETQVSKLGLGNRIFLPGKTDRPWYELNLADIFALSSDFEGFPNALLEAMALGKACVATDCRSGPRELSHNGEAVLLVKPGDVDAMSASLAALMADDELRLRLGELARRAVYEDCEINVVLGKWNELFCTLIQ